ncbi:SGNH/GDSL hydrolase family protein [Calidifontibacter terrae]
MKRTFGLITAAAALVATSAPAYATPAGTNPKAESGLYVAMGDSLAAGYQPGQGDDKAGGYVGQVYSSARSQFHGLKMTNLACSGETTSSLIANSKCTYAGGSRSQLDTAINLMRSSGKTKLVTLDVGANDVQTCVARTGSIDLPCLQQGLINVATNLPTIVKKVRAAAGPDAQIVVLNYYNPFLVFWVAGNPALAQYSQGLQKTLNDSIAAAAASGDAQVADIATTFKSTDWTLTPTALGNVPTNVAMICGYTWMCSKTDIHANDAGYTLMANTVSPLVAGPTRAHK